MNRKTIKLISEDCPCGWQGGCPWRDHYTRSISDQERNIIQISLFGLYGKKIGVEYKQEDPHGFYNVVVPRWNNDGLAGEFAKIWEETQNYEEIKKRLML